MDIGTIGGILFAIACILGGQALEGGHAGSLVQATAAIIVLGGTMGAVAVSFPVSDLKRGMVLAKMAFQQKKSDIGDLIKQVVELAGIARREGVLALEQRMAEIKDPFLKRAVGFLVDGVDAAVARDALETEIGAEYDENVVGAKVFESAGGYSPTVGIIGAVLGLIHVMENLSDPSKLGGGIATAFVATVYGVGVANLIFLPLANKIKRKLHVEKERKTLIAEGVLSIQAGLNPRVLEEKLAAYAGGHAPAKSADAGGAAEKA
jgi:chemotaxis protein MotA